MEPPTRSDVGRKSQESEFTQGRILLTQDPQVICVTQSKESPDPTGCWTGGEGPRPVSGDTHTTRESLYSEIPGLSQTRLVPENWY